MTDITELAQREKFEAWWGREYKHLESSKYTDAVPHIKYGFWMAYQAGGAELVEALEKAQRYIEELREWNAGLAQESCEYQQRIAELESFRTAYMEWSDKTAWVQTDKRFDVLKPWGKHRADVLKEYIQHLESRTVKLPKKNIGWDREEDDCWNNAIDACAEVLAAAGIKVEAE